ncbi:MAG: class I SAM-dependent rRNA methyltransferase [Eubacterium sp.]|nr:class I SAM-dependent rRNA methyltransferase [Eubacterium sp.]
MEDHLVAKASVTLRKGGGRTIKSGGAWIFDNEIESIRGDFENGDIIRVYDFDGYFLGYGFYNINSKIQVRMLSRRTPEPISEAFLRRHVRDAWKYRKTVLEDTSSCRVIYGEADWLPGLIVDKYEDVLVVQSLALGIDRLKGLLLDALREELEKDGIAVRGIYERSDASVRRKEGMQPYKGFIGPAFNTRVGITENGIQYEIDVANGQKTGFFLDQKFNRQAIWPVCGGKRVLDCFTHVGTFALNAAKAGAYQVIGLDISSQAVEEAKENAARNGMSDRVQFFQADVLKELPRLAQAGEKFDVVVLDPPAFTKSREATRRAVKGYREINLRAMKLIRDGGYLATCSCSHFMTQELFAKTIQEAARSAHRRLRQVEFRTQAPDHPVLWTDGEETSYYLKFFIFQVCEEL